MVVVFRILLIVVFFYAIYYYNWWIFHLRKFNPGLWCVEYRVNGHKFITKHEIRRFLIIDRRVDYVLVSCSRDEKEVPRERSVDDIIGECDRIEFVDDDGNIVNTIEKPF